MRKFYDTVSEEIFTEEQLSAFYAQGEGDRELYPTFESWLQEITGKNGTLEEIAPDSEINRLRKSVARDIARDTDLDYDQILEIMNNWNVFGTWTIWEINHRPVDVDELSEIILEQIENEQKGGD